MKYLHRILAFLLVLALWSTPALAVGPVGGGGAPGWTQIYGIQPRPEMHYLPYHADATSAEGAQTWTRFLIDDLPGIDGPGWDLLECRITAGGGGRLVPADSHDLDSLPGAAVALATNDDWCVLRALTGNGGTRWVLYVELQAWNTINVAVCPLDNWVTGGGDASPPAWMAGCFAAGDLNLAGTLIPFDCGNGHYSTIADTSMVQFITDTAGVIRGWGYYGELDGCDPADTRCFVAWDTPGTARIVSTSPLLNRYYGGAVLTTGIVSPPYSAASWALATGAEVNRPGGYQTYAAQVRFHDAGALHTAGRLRGVQIVNADAAALTQTADLLSLGIYTAPQANAGGIVIRWDGATAYPGAAALVLSHGGWRSIPADMIVPAGGNY